MGLQKNEPIKMTTPQEATRAALTVLSNYHSNGTMDEALARLGVDPSPPVQFWREFVKAGGFQLDPLLWCVEKDATAIMAGMIETAIINGWDASKAAAQFLYLSGVSCDVMRADINTVVEGYDDFDAMITAMFAREINRANLGSSVALWYANLLSLEELDTPPKTA